MDKAAVLEVKIVPNASRNEVIGWLEGGVLKVKVQAPPEGGRANKALIGLLAGELGLPKNRVTIQSGETSRHKRIAVAGLSKAEVLAKLKAAA